MSVKTIPVGISNRHIHISQPDLEKLFGRGFRLTKLRDISQRGQYAANETLDVLGPRGELRGVRIVGPPRGRTQVEISPSDAYRLGIKTVVRYSGDLDGSAGAKLKGPAGELDLAEGLIIPQRHIHMSPQDARAFGVYDRARVIVAPVEAKNGHAGSETRAVIFDNVLIRVDPSFVLDFHVDTDEANAAGLKNGDRVQITGFSRLNSQYARQALVTENDVRQAIMSKSKICIGPRTLVTPAALELGKAHNIFSGG